MVYQQTCLPVCIWPYLWENWPAVHISQNMKKEFPESTEIMTWMNVSVDGVIVHWYLRISCHFRCWSIQPILIAPHPTPTPQKNFKPMKNCPCHFLFCLFLLMGDASTKKKKKYGQNRKIQTQAVWSTDRSFFGGVGRSASVIKAQSLEYIAETRILTELKIVEKVFLQHERPEWRMKTT